MPEGQEGGNTQDNGGGAGGAAGAGGAGKKRHPAKKVDALITHLRNTYGSTHAALSGLANTNLDLEAELTDLRARMPKDGDVVMPKAEAEAYRALGAPDKVAARVQKADELEAAVAQRDRADRHREFGRKAAVNADVLAKMADREGFDVADVREEERDGRKVPVLYVRPANDAKGEPTPLDAYAEAHGFTEFLPALSAGTTGTPSDGRTRGGGTPGASPSSGTAYPAQAGAGARQSGGGPTAQQRLDDARKAVAGAF